MKVITNEKTGTKKVVYNKYELKGAKACPECKRPLSEYDLEFLDANGKRNCPKCGAHLIK